MAFRDFAQAHGLAYLIVTLPAKYPGDARIAAIQKQFNRDKIKYYALFFLAQSISPKDFGLSSSDAHPSPMVHRKIGEMLSEYIRENYLKAQKGGGGTTALQGGGATPSGPEPPGGKIN